MSRRRGADFEAINKAAGDGIRLLREDQGMTVDQIAKLLNVTAAELRSYEGAQSAIPAATLFLCTKIFDTTHSRPIEAA